MEVLGFLPEYLLLGSQALAPIKHRPHIKMWGCVNEEQYVPQCLRPTIDVGLALGELASQRGDKEVTETVIAEA